MNNAKHSQVGKKQYKKPLITSRIPIETRTGSQLPSNYNCPVP
jgi:hypothetical protein